LTDTPTSGVTASSAMKMPAPSTASRRACATGNIDTPNNTGSDTPTHISCRQK
jgi:hypothetical protein